MNAIKMSLRLKYSFTHLLLVAVYNWEKLLTEMCVVVNKMLLIINLWSLRRRISV